QIVSAPIRNSAAVCGSCLSMAAARLRSASATVSFGAFVSRVIRLPPGSALVPLPARPVPCPATRPQGRASFRPPAPTSRPARYRPPVRRRGQERRLSKRRSLLVLPAERSSPERTGQRPALPPVVDLRARIATELH